MRRRQEARSATPPQRSAVLDSHPRALSQQGASPLAPGLLLGAAPRGAARGRRTRCGRGSPRCVRETWRSTDWQWLSVSNGPEGRETEGARQEPLANGPRWQCPRALDALALPASSAPHAALVASPSVSRAAKRPLMQARQPPGAAAAAAAATARRSACGANRTMTTAPGEMTNGVMKMGPVVSDERRWGAEAAVQRAGRLRCKGCDRRAPQPPPPPRPLPRLPLCRPESSFARRCLPAPTCWPWRSTWPRRCGCGTWLTNDTSRWSGVGWGGVG